MPKVKAARKSTHIDMTAMTDVAFLLLTFFMLTAKAKPAEPVKIDTPSSISDTKLPDANTLTVLVDPEGKIYLDPAGTRTRKLLIDNVVGNLPEEEKIAFATAGAFGVPIKDLSNWLKAEPGERGKMNTGIPADTSLNELGTWVHQARLAQFQLKQEGVVSSEYVLVVKADATTPYPAIEKVFNTFKDVNVNKWNLITNLEADPNKLIAVPPAH
jgi:biopolymer transport protein ExbD